MTEKIRAIKHIYATIFVVQNALRSSAPEFKWSGLGNSLGDYGECVAIDYQGFIKADPGVRGFDATDENGKKVQKIQETISLISDSYPLFVKYMLI